MARTRVRSLVPDVATRCAWTRLALCSLLIATSGVAQAATHVDVVTADLAPLIERAARSPSRFAVDVAHAISLSTTGEWSSSGELRTWRYSAQIPGAVSMSFHATEALLPAGATLTVTAGGVAYVYTSEKAHGGELWSRIGRGDALAFELTVAAEDVERVHLEIASLQAGFRGLSAEVPNHARYDEVRKQALSATAVTTSCAENWTCNLTPTNEGPGNATAALIIANVGQCSGVLLNDVPGDGVPYVLTARHCQDSGLNGGSPGAAADVTVYWNAVSACGEPLGSIYDAGIFGQSGAETVVEQQDAWLIRLRELPVVDAYYAGWDATGAAFVGGFSAHHANGTSRQFIGWYGQAAYFTKSGAALGVPYDSTLWGTVNALGASGPGASGAGLFDETGRLVGSLVRGLVSGDATGVCPSSSPPAPSQATATSLSTALSGVFLSVADLSSTTGAATLQSVLDPDQTGALVLDGKKRPITVALTDYTETFFTGTRVPLDWNGGPGAETCTASGGESGDGWAGAVDTRGSKEITSFDGGDVIYTITCTDGERVGTATVTLHWALSMPSVSLTGSLRPEYGVPFGVEWRSNVRPCTTTGGTGTDGWGGALDPNGFTWLTANVVGSVTYTLTCGSGERLASAALTVTVSEPFVSLRADAVTLRLGQPVNIAAFRQGAPCVKTGGAPDDGWEGTVPVDYAGGPFNVAESNPGTYTYTMACGSAAHIATDAVSVTFNDDPPAVSVRASPSSGVVNVDHIDVSWDANVRPCRTRVDGPNGTGFDTEVTPHGTFSIQEPVIGQYVFTIDCGSAAETAQASTIMDWTGTPAVELNAPTTAVQGSLFSIFYSSNVVPCVTSGGSAGDGWAGQSNHELEVIQVVEQSAGTQSFTITCGSGAQTATDTVSVEIVADAPQVTLGPDNDHQVTGQPVTITWSSNTSPCVLNSGSPGDGWSGSFGSSGSVTVTALSAGTVFYGIICGTDPLIAFANTGVIYADIPAPTLTASKTEVTVGEIVTLTWASADGSACFATGGNADGDGWFGDRAASGSLSVRTTLVGSSYFNLKCGQSLEASVAVNVNALPTVPEPPVPPNVSLSASASSFSVGESFALTWVVSNADTCTASGGATGDGWAGALDRQGGSMTLRENVGGTFVYTITCLGAGGTTAEAARTVTVSQVAAPQPSSGGGGGAIGLLDAALLLAAGLLKWRPQNVSRESPMRLRARFARVAR